MGGVARRSWARNPNAMSVAMAYNANNPTGDHITIPYVTDEEMIDLLIKDRLKGECAD